MFGLFDFFCVYMGAAELGRQEESPDPDPETPTPTPKTRTSLLQRKKKPSVEGLKVCHYAGKYNYKCD